MMVKGVSDLAGVEKDDQDPESGKQVLGKGS